MKKPVWGTDRLLFFYPDNLNQKVNSFGTKPVHEI